MYRKFTNFDKFENYILKLLIYKPNLECQNMKMKKLRECKVS